MQTAVNNNTPMTGEILRKTIHFASAAISIGYYYIDRNIVLVVLGVMLFFMLGVEYVKYKSTFVYNLYMKYFKHMLREHEYNMRMVRINGASWVVISCIICIIVFPKLIAITGMLMLSLADSTAGLLGRLYGKKQYAPNRSYVGTAAFFIVGVIIVLLSPKYLYTTNEYIIGFAAVAVTTLAEAMNLPIDDNFTIPVVASATLYVLYLIFFGAGVF
jgi:dolichol kinase